VVAALVHLAVFGSLGLQHDLVPRLAVATRATRTFAVTAIATFATRRIVLLLLANLGEVEDLALVDPGLVTDDLVGRLGLGVAVVDVGAQREIGRASCRER